MTNLFASGSLDLEDVARFVGHTDTATTRGYVQHEGDRPRQISAKALELLDPNWSAQSDDSEGRAEFGFAARLPGHICSILWTQG